MILIVIVKRLFRSEGTLECHCLTYFSVPFKSTRTVVLALTADDVRLTGPKAEPGLVLYRRRSRCCTHFWCLSPLVSRQLPSKYFRNFSLLKKSVKSKWVTWIRWIRRFHKFFSVFWSQIKIANFSVKTSLVKFLPTSFDEFFPLFGFPKLNLSLCLLFGWSRMVDFFISQECSSEIQKVIVTEPTIRHSHTPFSVCVLRVAE